MLADRRVRYYEDARLDGSVLSGLNMRGELDIECWVLHPADPSRAEHEHIELLGWMGKPRHWREKGGAARSMGRRRPTAAGSGGCVCDEDQWLRPWPV